MSTANKKIQRKTEWLELSDTAMEYHKNQFQNVYRSTIVFCEWLEQYKLFKSEISGITFKEKIFHKSFIY